MQTLTPYLVVMLAAIISALGWYLRTVGAKLSDVALKLATLIEHTLNMDGDMVEVKKYHDEIIDLKVATAELDVKAKGLEHQLDQIQLMYSGTK